MPRTSSPSRPSALLGTLLACAVLSACGGSSDSDGGGATTGNGAGGPTGSGGGAANPGGGGTGANPNAVTDGADLSHVPVALPRVDVAPANDPALYSQEGADRAANLDGSFGVILDVVENHGNDLPFSCKTLGAEYASCSVVNLHVKAADGELEGDDWALYFHSIRRVLRVDSDDFDVELVNGDLNRLVPAEGYDGIDGDVATVRLVTEFNWLIESDFMPRAWLVRDGQSPLLAPNTDENTVETAYAMPITGGNRFAFNGEPVDIASPATRFAANAPAATAAAGFTTADIQRRIVPKPPSVTAGAGALDISGGFSFAGAPLG